MNQEIKIISELTANESFTMAKKYLYGIKYNFRHSQAASVNVYPIEALKSYWSVVLVINHATRQIITTERTFYSPTTIRHVHKFLRSAGFTVDQPLRKLLETGSTVSSDTNKLYTVVHYDGKCTL